MNVLTQRIGPLPAWAWGGLAAVAVWFVFLRARPGAPSGASAASGTSPSGQATTDYSLGYAQGLQAAGTQGLQAAASQGQQVSALFTAVVTGAYSGGQTTGARSAPSFTAPQTRRIPAGTSLNLTSQQIQDPGGQGQAWYKTDAGDYVWAADISNVVPTGQGGPATGRKHAIGSRSAWMWTDAHSLIGAPVRYPHYVRAVGGPASHNLEVGRVAAQSGVHPARIRMLNPQHTGRIRIA